RRRHATQDVAEGFRGVPAPVAVLLGLGVRVKLLQRHALPAKLARLPHRRLLSGHETPRASPLSKSVRRERSRAVPWAYRRISRATRPTRSRPRRLEGAARAARLNDRKIVEVARTAVGHLREPDGKPGACTRSSEAIPDH